MGHPMRGYLRRSVFSPYILRSLIIKMVILNQRGKMQIQTILICCSTSKPPPPPHPTHKVYTYMYRLYKVAKMYSCSVLYAITKYSKTVLEQSYKTCQSFTILSPSPTPTPHLLVVLQKVCK